MSDDYNDEYDDIIDRFRKFFKIDSDLFDVDFFFLPEQMKNLEFNSKNPNVKGFKVSYHFEKGMDKPEIRIEGDIDQEKLKEYLKGLNIEEAPHIKYVNKPNKPKLIDAKTLSIEPCEVGKSCVVEPFSEVNDFGDYVEIILEVPGVESGHVILSLNENGRILKISAKNPLRSYEKEVRLPFKTSLDGHVLDVNNGIASIILKKKI